MDRLYAAIDDLLVPLDEAVIPLSQSFCAVGVYETLKVREGRIFFAKDHLARLFRSALLIKLPVTASPERMLERLKNVVTKSHIDNLNIKIMLTQCPDEKTVRSYILPTSIPLLPGHRANEYPEPLGLNAFLYHGERHFPQAKSLGLLFSTMALNEAKKHNCWDAILIDRHGELREGSRTNLYWFEQGKIYSPPADKILAGVTQQHFIRALQEQGIKMHRGQLLLEDFLSKPRPLLLSSTSIVIQPVKNILTGRGSWLQLPEEARIHEFSQWYRHYLRCYQHENE